MVNVPNLLDALTVLERKIQPGTGEGIQALSAGELSRLHGILCVGAGEVISVDTPPVHQELQEVLAILGGELQSTDDEMHRNAARESARAKALLLIGTCRERLLGRLREERAA